MTRRVYELYGSQGAICQLACPAASSSLPRVRRAASAHVRGFPIDLPPEWPRLLDDHARAVEEYRIAAGALDHTAWLAPIAPGKWSPAEVTAHVSEAYRVLSAELGGADGMRLRGSKLQRLVLRHTILPRLLRGNPFPPGVRAPRETLPTEVLVEKDLALTSLADRAEQFTRRLTERADRQKVWLTHAYFGRLSAREGLELSTVHTRHHARQLAAIDRSSLPL